MGFRLGSIPVRIHFAFFFIALIVVSDLQSPDKIAVGAVVVFIAVLLHELGHALMGKAFGLEPQIDLHGMGGLTSWGNEGRKLSHFRGILVSLAGPLIGFVVLGALLLAIRLGLRVPEHPLVLVAFGVFYNVTIFWGILNLMPLLPLDGGNIMRSFLHIVTKGKGEKPARYISVVVGGLGAAYALYTRNLWIGAMAAMYTYLNIQALRAGIAPVRPVVQVDVEDHLRRAYAALERHEGGVAVTLLRPVLEAGPTGQKREEVLRMFAYALLIEGAWRELMMVLTEEKSAIGDAELQRYASTARELDRPEEAAQIDALRTA